MPTIAETLAALDAVAPLRLAASWDNTGLLLEGDRAVETMLLTIDLSASVLREALKHDVDLVVAYHPPIFSGLKRLTRRHVQTATLLSLARQGVHVYSPHTALDAVAGGINDWLLEAFGPLEDVQPLVPDLQTPTAGVGRRATLHTPRSLNELTQNVKNFLGLEAVRVSEAATTIRSVAVCPGAGGSVFTGLEGVDLLLTGEMRHHDVLGFAAQGVSTILTEHTNTERGYLPRYAERIRSSLGTTVHIAATDRDPLQIA